MDKFRKAYNKKYVNCMVPRDKLKLIKKLKIDRDMKEPIGVIVGFAISDYIDIVNFQPLRFHVFKSNT